MCTMAAHHDDGKLSELLRVMKCPICKDMLTEPFATVCGHTFCHDCISRHLQSRQRCPNCSTFVTADSIHPVFAMEKMLAAATKLSTAAEGPEAEYLVRLLSDTSMIQSCDQIDTLVGVLRGRRSDLENQEQAAQLRLLQLFLLESKQHLEQQAHAGKQRLACIAADKAATAEACRAITAQYDIAAAQQSGAPQRADQSRDDASRHAAGNGNVASVILARNAGDAVAHSGHDAVGQQLADVDALHAIGPLGTGRQGGADEQAAAAVIEHLCASDPSRAAALRAHTAHMQQHLQELMQRYVSMCSPQSGGEGAHDAGSAAATPAEAAQNGSTARGRGRASSEARMRELQAMLSAAMQYTKLGSVLEMIPETVGKGRSVTGLAFSSDGSTLALGGASAAIKLHNYEAVLAGGTRVHTPAGEIPTETRVSVLAFSPARASHIVSSGAPDTHISLWDAETAAEIQRFQDHNQRVWSLAFSQKQPTVFASGSDDCTLRLWSTEQQRSTLTIGFDTNVCCVAACPWDAHMFAAGTAGHSMAVYDVRYPAAPVSNLTGLQKAISYVKFMSRHEIVASRINSSLLLWSLRGDEGVRTMTGHVNNRNFVGMEVNGLYVACGSETSQVHVYCKHLSAPMLTHTLKPQRFPASNAYFTLSTTWKPNSNHLLAAASTGSVHVLSMERPAAESQDAL